MWDDFYILNVCNEDSNSRGAGFLFLMFNHLAYEVQQKYTFQIMFKVFRLNAFFDTFSLHCGILPYNHPITVVAVAVISKRCIVWFKLRINYIPLSLTL